MTPDAIDEAARLLFEATRTGVRIPPLPAAVSPHSTADALAIQDALLERLNEPIGAWKVARASDGAFVWGAILASACHATPASVQAGRVLPAGIEGEIAFRLEQDLPMRAEPYAARDIAAAVVPVPAIEVVGSRYISYPDTPFLDRLADRMSNGAFVVGACTGEGAAPDFTAVRVRQAMDGVVTIDRVGGHPRKDPLLPAIEFVQAIQHRRSLKAGQLITTGTFTGMVFARAGQRYGVEFENFGRVEVTLA